MGTGAPKNYQNDSLSIHVNPCPGMLLALEQSKDNIEVNMALESFAFLQIRRIVIIVLILFFSIVSNSLAATLTVTKTADTNDGTCNTDCSLREAITASALGDTIGFNIPASTDSGCVSATGVCTISPTSALPALSKGSVTIDGYSQSSASPNTNDFPSAWNGTIKIVLNGTSAGSSSNGLQITSTNNVIMGLAINRFKSRGILINNKNSNKIQGCIIGLDDTGETIQKNTSYGIYVYGSAATLNIIGTDGDGSNDAAERNIISGNGGAGIYITSNGQTTIAGNLIGTDKDGTTDLGNTASGIQTSSTANSNVIGTNGDGVYDAGEGNLIAGNSTYGVYLAGSSDIIAGNYFGVDITGTTRLRNDTSAIAVAGSSTRIGTNSDGVSDEIERNIISGSNASAQRGVYGTGDNLIIAGNFIGLDLAGTSAIANDRGIQATSTTDNWRIGTNGDGINDEIEGNVISGNVYNLHIEGNNHVIAGNIVGTNASGTGALSGSATGLRLYGGTGHRVGTNADGVSDEIETNLISGHTQYGINVEQNASTVTIAGNLIGTDITGSLALANAAGIGLGAWNGATAATNVRIGTNGDGVNDEVERNVISGNAQGLRITNASSCTIAGNLIGLAADGESTLGNTDYGILFAYSGGSNNLFGGDTESEANIIAHNGNTTAEYGIKILGASSDNNQILRNSFSDNAGLGIFLNGDGANNNIAAPVIVAQAINGSNIDLSGTAGADETVQLFLADEDGEEGETFLGETTADASGAWIYTLTENKTAGTIFVATTTNTTDGTSAFSAAYTLANEAPTADAQGLSTPEDTNLTITFSGNDVNGDTISSLVSSLPLHGTLYQTTDGITPGDAIAIVPASVTDSEHRVIYVPEANNNGVGVGTFSFITNDGTADSSEASVTIDVTAVQDAPTTSNLSSTTNEDTPVSATLDATDVDGDALTYTVVTMPAHGTMTAFDTATGQFTYAPVENFNGTDTLTFQVNDGLVDSNISEATFTVQAINDSPVAADVTASTTEGTRVSIMLSGSDVDSGDTLTYSLVSFPAHGSLASFNPATGSVSYQPDTDFSGSDSFSYKVADGTANSNTATVSITVTATPDAEDEGVTDDAEPNTPPTVDAGLSRHEVAGTTITLKGSASDADGDSLAYQWSQTEGTTVTLSDAETATMSFTAPASSANETLVFLLTVSDGSNSTTDSVRITLLTPERSAENAVLISQRLIDYDAAGNRIVESTITDDEDTTVNEIILWNSCHILTCSDNAANVLTIDASHVAFGDPYCDNDQGQVVLLDRDALDCSQTVDLRASDTASRSGVLTARGAKAGDYFGASIKLGDLDGDGISELYAAAPGNHFGAVYGLNLTTLHTTRIFVGSEEEQLRSSLLAFANIDAVDGTEAVFGLAPDSSDLWTDEGPLTGIVSGTTSLFNAISAGIDLPSDIDFSYTISDFNIMSPAIVTTVLAGSANTDAVTDILFGSNRSCEFGILFGQTSPFTDDVSLANSTTITCSEDSSFAQALLADVSGDGYSDLIVGFPDKNDGNGLIAILPGPFESDELTYSLDDAVLISGNTAEGIGERLFVGDYDGDGILDIFTSSVTSDEEQTKVIIFSNPNAQASSENGDAESGDNTFSFRATGSGCALASNASESTFFSLLWLVFFVPLLIHRVLATVRTYGNTYSY